MRLKLRSASSSHARKVASSAGNIGGGAAIDSASSEHMPLGAAQALSTAPTRKSDVVSTVRNARKARSTHRLLDLPANARDRASEGETSWQR